MALCGDSAPSQRSLSTGEFAGSWTMVQRGPSFGVPHVGCRRPEGSTGMTPSGLPRHRLCASICPCCAVGGHEAQQEGQQGSPNPQSRGAVLWAASFASAKRRGCPARPGGTGLCCEPIPRGAEAQIAHRWHTRGFRTRRLVHWLMSPELFAAGLETSACVRL